MCTHLLHKRGFGQVVDPTAGGNTTLLGALYSNNCNRQKEPHRTRDTLDSGKASGPRDSSLSHRQ